MEIIDKQFLLSLYIFLPKVGIAALCGFIIGLEREFKKKPAGLRSMVLICVGCALLTALSVEISKAYSSSDPSRIIAQIMTGIGFLGGGVIMKYDDKIIGITTAAFIWVISAIGIMSGHSIFRISMSFSFRFPARRCIHTSDYHNRNVININFIRIIRVFYKI